MREAVSLSESGYEVTLIARASASEVKSGVLVVGLPTYKSRLLRMSYGVARATIKAWSLRADVYHVHDPELLTGLALLHLLGYRTVYDAHELLSAQVLSKPYVLPILRRLMSRICRVIERLGSWAADEIITPSKEYAAPWPPHKTTIVANYPGFSEFSLDESDSAKGAPYVVYLGLISRVRGILQLVKAMAVVNTSTSMKLLLIGPFENENLLEECQASEGWQFVDYLGVVAHSEVGIHLTGAVAGIVNFLPSPHNSIGQPNKLYEYMAAGIPVVASDFPIWRETISHSGCGVLVDPTSPQSIAAGIVQVVSNPEVAREMGEAARRAMQNSYNWEGQFAKLNATYQRLLNA